MSPRVLQTRLKWTARIVGLLVCIFFFLFAVREIVPTFNQNSDVNSLYFILLLSLVVGGYVASWQWELPGALVQVVGGICMFIFMASKSETFLGIIFGLPFVLTGFLLIYSWVVWKLRDVE